MEGGVQRAADNIGQRWSVARRQRSLQKNCLLFFPKSIIMVLAKDGVCRSLRRDMRLSEEGVREVS